MPPPFLNSLGKTTPALKTGVSKHCSYNCLHLNRSNISGALCLYQGGMNSTMPSPIDLSEVWVQFTLHHTFLFFQELQQNAVIKIQKELYTHTQLNNNAPYHESSWQITPSSYIIISEGLVLLLIMCIVSWGGLSSLSILMKRQSKVLDILFSTRVGNKTYARERKRGYYILTPAWVGYRVKRWGS